MAFDGITVKALTKELNEKITDGRLFKIAEPEKDELFLTIKTKSGAYKLIVSASATLPLLYFTSNSKQSPLTAPNFCMLLRKYINNGKIVKVTQPSLERIINFEIDHFNELGDYCKKNLVVELMGKYSNIIFLDDDKIIDSIKHVGANVSSVREVLPGRNYFIPCTDDKINPFLLTEDYFLNTICNKPLSIAKAIYSSITGFSPIIAEELAFRASVDSNMAISCLNANEKTHLFNCISNLIDDISNENFNPCIIYEGDKPIEFSAIKLTIYNDKTIKYFDSISEVLETYYAQKEKYTRIRQRSTDLRQLITTALNKNNKKYALQLKQLEDTNKRNKFKVYGELLTTYGYNVPEGAKSTKVLNYYTNEELEIPLEPDFSAIENAKKYFDKYSKLKRTFEALSSITKETKAEIDHLESMQTALDLAEGEDDLKQLKEELIETGYIRRKSKEKPSKTNIKPLHFISSDGFHIYVGKNNIQNEFISFKLADNNDWWFHAKGVPGSHVIVKSNGNDLPDSTFEDAGRLAAHFSKNRSLSKVDVDYLIKKNLKKPGGGKPGFVIYHTNYSLTIDSDISNITQIMD